MKILTLTIAKNLLLIHAAQEALRVAARAVGALSAEAHGELAAEGRLLWLLSLKGFDSPDDLWFAIERAASVSLYVSNWSDGCRATSRQSELRDGLEKAAGLLSELLKGEDTAAGVVTDADRGDVALARTLVLQWAGKLPPKRRSEVEEDDFLTKFVAPAEAAAQAALEALLAVADDVRAQVPEELR